MIATTSTAPENIRHVGGRYHLFLDNGQTPTISLDHELIETGPVAGITIGCTICHQQPASFSLGVFIDAGDHPLCAPNHEARRAGNDPWGMLCSCNSWAQCETYACRGCAERLAPGYADACTAHNAALGRYRTSGAKADEDAAAEAFGPMREHLAVLLRALGHDEQLVTVGIAQKTYFISFVVATTTRNVGTP